MAGTYTYGNTGDINHYLQDLYATTAATTCNYTILTSGVDTTFWINAPVVDGLVDMQISKEKGKLHPNLYFLFAKKKLKPLIAKALQKRLKGLEKAFEVTMKAGQTELGEKFYKEYIIKAREAVIAAHGVTKYVEYNDVQKHRRDIMGGHIADTKLKDYARVIPKHVLKAIEATRKVFDDFIVYHYWGESIQPDVKTMTPSEKDRMRDPIIFGVIKETNRLYFVADWEDEYCHLTFDKLPSAIIKQEIK